MDDFALWKTVCGDEARLGWPLSVSYSIPIYFCPHAAPWQEGPGSMSLYPHTRVSQPQNCWHFGLDNSLLRRIAFMLQTFSSIPDLHPLGTSSVLPAPTPSWQLKISPDIEKCSLESGGGQNDSHLRTTATDKTQGSIYRRHSLNTCHWRWRQLYLGTQLLSTFLPPLKEINPLLKIL